MTLTEHICLSQVLAPVRSPGSLQHLACSVHVLAVRSDVFGRVAIGGDYDGVLERPP